MLNDNTTRSDGSTRNLTETAKIPPLYNHGLIRTLLRSDKIDGKYKLFSMATKSQCSEQGRLLSLNSVCLFENQGSPRFALIKNGTAIWS